MFWNILLGWMAIMVVFNLMTSSDWMKSLRKYFHGNNVEQ